jgi:hypothetical protein
MFPQAYDSAAPNPQRKWGVNSLRVMPETYLKLPFTEQYRNMAVKALRKLKISLTTM